jgi:hypothetical protein
LRLYHLLSVTYRHVQIGMDHTQQMLLQSENYSTSYGRCQLRLCHLFVATVLDAMDRDKAFGRTVGWMMSVALVPLVKCHLPPCTDWYGPYATDVVAE